MCELLPTKGCASLVTLGHRALQRILTGFTSWLRCCTDVAQWRSTELCTMFGNLLVCLVSWCLSPFSAQIWLCQRWSWTGAQYIYFRGLLTLREFCQVQNSLFIQVLHSRISAALLCGTRSVWAKLCGVVQGKLLRMACHFFHTYTWQGGHHVVLLWHIF